MLSLLNINSIWANRHTPHKLTRITGEFRESQDALKQLESNDITVDFFLLCETFLTENSPNIDYKTICHAPGYEFEYSWK